MAQVCTYLNFRRETETAFNFYKSVFGGQFSGYGIMRFRDIPPSEGNPPISDEDSNLIMHMELPILGGHLLMGSDMPESMQYPLHPGNNVTIMLVPDTREETQKLFSALSSGGSVTQELQDMFWGDYYGSCTDKFGINWMFNCSEKKS